jgi:hypothetical protein
LKAAEAKLPAPVPIYDDEPDSIDMGHGMSMTLRISTHSRTDGFEKLRDIIAKYRRDWTRRYFDTYLDVIWRGELREASRQLNRFIVAKGKPPTAKQFAKDALKATNHWFGGNVDDLYTAIGEKSPIKPARVSLMPLDRDRFAHAVFSALGGAEPETKDWTTLDQEAQKAQRQVWNRYYRFRDLAKESLRFVQLEEALGVAPTMDDFGRRNFSYVAEEVWGDAEEGWRQYIGAISTARATTPSAPPSEDCRATARASDEKRQSHPVVNWLRGRP